MKILIWVAGLFITALIEVFVFGGAGKMGAIAAFIVFYLYYHTCSKLSAKWDNRKKKIVKETNEQSESLEIESGSEDKKSVPKVMYCRKCGKKLLDDDRFCRFCGAGVLLEGSELSSSNEELQKLPTQSNVVQFESEPVIASLKSNGQDYKIAVEALDYDKKKLEFMDVILGRMTANDYSGAIELCEKGIDKLGFAIENASNQKYCFPRLVNFLLYTSDVKDRMHKDICWCGNRVSELYKMKAISNWKLGNLNEAIEGFKKCFEYSPTEVDGRILYAEFSDENNDSETAKNNLIAAMKYAFFPAEIGRIYKTYAVCCEHAHKYTSAERMYAYSQLFDQNINAYEHIERIEKEVFRLSEPEDIERAVKNILNSNHIEEFAVDEGIPFILAGRKKEIIGAGLSPDIVSAKKYYEEKFEINFDDVKEKELM